MTELTAPERQLFDALVANSWGLLAVTDGEGRIEQASPSLALAFELPLERLLGRSLGSLVAPEDQAKLAEPLKVVLNGQKSGLERVLRLALPGGPNLFEVRLRPLHGTRPGQFFLFKARDVQAEKDAQHLLMMYQRLGVFGQLAAGFAHEVRNPLASVVAAAQLAQRRLKQGQDAGEQLDVVLRQAERLKVLMEDVLQHARSSRQALSVVDPCAVMEKAVEQGLQQFGPGAENVQVEQSCSVGRAKVWVTEDRLLRLLSNLVLNALQALGGQGGRLRARARIEGNEALLSVEDDGPGFSPQALPRIFEPFFTTKPTGSGLGLWIAQSLSHEMGGRLSAEAAQPHGAVFTLRLPLVVPPELEHG
jgi:signal transduction histidine kinase